MRNTNLNDFVGNFNAQYINEPNKNQKNNTSVNSLSAIQADGNVKNALNYFTMSNNNSGGNANKNTIMYQQTAAGALGDYSLQQHQQHHQQQSNQLNIQSTSNHPNVVAAAAISKVNHTDNHSHPYYNIADKNQLNGGDSLAGVNIAQNRAIINALQSKITSMANVDKMNIGNRKVMVQQPPIQMRHQGSSGNDPINEASAFNANNNNNTNRNVRNNDTSNHQLEQAQNSVNKLRNFFSQLITLTSQKHSLAISEQVKQAVAKVISGSFSVEEFITTVARLTQCAPAQREMIDFIKVTLPYFRGNDELSNIGTDASIAHPATTTTTATATASAINPQSGPIGNTVNHAQLGLVGMNYPKSTSTQKLVNFNASPSTPLKSMGMPSESTASSTTSAMYNSLDNLPTNSPTRYNNYLTQTNNMFSKTNRNSNLNPTATTQNIDHAMALNSKITQQQNAFVAMPPNRAISNFNDGSSVAAIRTAAANNKESIANINNNKLLETNDPTIMDLKRKSLDPTYSIHNSNAHRKPKKSKIDKPPYNSGDVGARDRGSVISLEHESVPQNNIFNNEANLKRSSHSGDQLFFDIKHITQQIVPIIRSHGSLNVNYEDLSVFCSLLSHAIEHRLRNVLVDLSKQVRQRVSTSTTQPNRLKLVDSRILSQYNFLDEVAILCAKKSKFIEEEKMLSLSRSKNKFESPEQLKLKERARQYVKDQEKLLATHAANVAAMQAIGDRRRRPFNNNPNDPQLSDTLNNSSNLSTHSSYISNNTSGNSNNNNNNNNSGSSLLKNSNPSIDLNALNRFKRSKPRRVTQNRITLNDVQLYFENDPFSRCQGYYYDSINFD